MLQSVDVLGDGNCLFRALSVGLYGDETHHSQLRQHIASHLASNYASLFEVDSSSSVDTESVASCVRHVERVNTEAGQESIVSAADYLQRPIHLYKFVTPPGVTPDVYMPRARKAVHPPIAIAFYEPGHYRAVINIRPPVAPTPTLRACQPQQLSKPDVQDF